MGIHAIVKAMVETGKRIDFVTVDGAEGGTGAAPVEFAQHLGSPLRDALVFVDNCLAVPGCGIEVKVAASAKIVSAYDIVKHCALGADWCNMARPSCLLSGAFKRVIAHRGAAQAVLRLWIPKDFVWLT